MVDSARRGRHGSSATWRTGRRAGRLGVWIAAAVVAACSSSDEEVRKGSLAEGCTINSDCAAPLVCAFRRCHTQCEATRDCPSGQRCVLAARPMRVCQLADERQCSHTSQCQPPQVCAVDGQCRDQCEGDRDCVPGQVCVAATCADPTELVDGGLPRAGDGGARVGQPCAYNSDCDPKLVCRSGACAVECVESRDCVAPALCVGGACTLPVADAAPPDGPGPDGGTGDGAPDASAGCKLNSDCPEPKVCLYGACSLECVKDVDCVAPKQCLGNRCRVPAPDGAPDGYGAACNHTSECTPGLVCGPSGQCVYQCLTSADCDTKAGFCCWQFSCVQGSVCAPDGGGGGTADGAADAGDAEAGKDCKTDSQCQDGVLCNGAERCVKGSCAPALKALCDDENPCTQDVCDEDGGACKNIPTGPIDQDKDGHYALGCGGNADDCDDTNPDVYPGHPEVCDLVDNNCDGVADEGLWKVSAPVNVSGADAGTVYPQAAGAPAIVRFGDGTFALLAMRKVGQNGAILAGHLGPTLAPLAPAAPIGPTLTAPPGWPQSVSLPLFPAAASDGTVLGAAFAAAMSYDFGYCPGGPNCFAFSYKFAASALRADEDLAGALTVPVSPTLDNGCPSAAGCEPAWWAQMQASAPAVAWNGKQFVLAWADTHEGGDKTTAHAYGAQMSAAGAFGGSHALLPNLADVAVPMAVSASAPTAGPVQLAVGATTALVAWQWKQVVGPNTVVKLRYAVFDTGLAAPLKGPFELTEAEDQYPTSAAHVGKSFVLAAQSLGGKAARIHRIDDASGLEAPGSSVKLANAGGGGDVKLAAAGAGVALTMARGTALSFGRAREDLAGGVTFTDVVPSGSFFFGAGIAPIDATHVAIAWTDGQVRAAMMSCGP